MTTLTQAVVTKTPAPAKGKTLIFDDHKDAPRGFGLRVTPTGKRAFILRYNASGRDRLMTVGDYPAWTLAAARKQAKALRRKIDGGADILAERRHKRAEGTVAEVAEAWCKDHADKLRSASSIRSAINRHLIPALGDAKITEVALRDVIGLLKSLAEAHPRQAGLLLVYLKLMFHWCEINGIITYNPVGTLKPKDISGAIKNKARTRVLDADEIRALWTAEAIGGVSNATLRALRFVLATGQRPGEVAKATTAEVKGDVWTIPAEHRGKTNDTHQVPLTATAKALLRPSSESLFGVDRHALSTAVRRAGLGWRPHDLRRTMRTQLAAAGVPEDVAEKTVGHVKKGIVAVYDQYQYAPEKRAALEVWERRLLAIVAGASPDGIRYMPPGIDTSAKVVPLHRRSA